MKKIKFILSLVALMAVAISCSIEGISDDTSLPGVSSGNVNKVFDISNDNSGNVKITPTGDGATSFTVEYGHGTDGPVSVAPGESTTHAYPEGDYTVKVTAISISGSATEQTFPLKVIYRAPENLEIKTTDEMKVSAKADYANSFLVFYGDVANEEGTPMAIDEVLPPHTYPATGGPFVLKVVALSGGAAKTEGTKSLFGFPIDFETAGVDYFFGTFGDVTFSKVANPNATGLNTSATVGKYTKPTGVPNWSGTYSPLNIPINFAYGKKIKVLAYNPDAANIGKKLNVELEWAIGGTPANGVAVQKAAFTTSGAWEELVFDYSAISGIPEGTKFTQLVLRFNDSDAGAGEVIYIDNVRLTN
ncbi:MAG TPA: PKD domain-containing protein [Flavobacterium sp.]|uniref:PKD domain-containing protein n=1 Tax=Flavobacterium sp. TaxID=239 RepID=UPI002DBB811B|nr:PKD domain-containing protein [Flavobacterium sp.]HEU4788573.1 PKD domain-containing protein [Flavobacterium sp.]